MIPYTMDMKILVISDTHGNQSMINDMVPIAETADWVIHLGDDYSDALPFIEKKIPTIRVPGTWGKEYQDPMIDNRRFETFNGWALFLSHTPTKDPHDLHDDIDPEWVIQQKKCHIFCHGHTHQPSLKQSNNVTILNPGHLKRPFDRNYPASYAIITPLTASCHIQVIDFQTSATIDCVTLK